MPIDFSISEAEARISELLRLVRAGKTVIVSDQGEPVAEFRPIKRATSTIEERLDELERRGVLVRSTVPGQPITPVVRCSGALKRFLAERSD